MRCIGRSPMRSHLLQGKRQSMRGRSLCGGRLNQIRAAVPALRKGQYSFDGCSAKGGWAFKRAYKNESYVLVAINGGATFSNVPAGTYTDIVTGKTYTGSMRGRSLCGVSCCFRRPHRWVYPS